MNVARLLTKATAAHGDRVAVRCGPVALTYRALDAATGRFAAAMNAHSLHTGDRVALFMPNNVEYVIALFGAFRAGLVAVPVNAKLHPQELAYILRDSGARVLISDANRADAARSAIDSQRVEHVYGVDDGFGAAFAALISDSLPTLGPVDVDPDDLAWLFYTSGTTGRPKGACLSHRNLVAMTMGMLADVCPFVAPDRVLHAAPLSHGSGLTLLCSIARGSENIIDDSAHFDPTSILRTIERDGITAIAFLAPTMIVMLLDADCRPDTSSLRLAVYGGGPILLEHARAMIARFGPVFAQIYGQGEAPMSITYLPPAQHDAVDQSALLSAGWPRTDVEVRVVVDDGRDVPPGEIGEVLVRGDVVMRGYWNNPVATAQALHGGWLHTGDIGTFDVKGRLQLLDRANDMIVSGGTNVYPREVEDALVQHPLVQEATVFGVPDRVWGERVVAAVVPRRALVPAELTSFVRTRLASFKKPTEIYVLSTLPKNANGKIMRREVRKQFLACDDKNADERS